MSARPRTVGPWALTAVLAVAAVAVTALAAGGDRPPLDGSAPVLPLLAALVAAAELLVVRVRVGRHVDALNLVEAVIAPLLLAYDAGTAVAAVAVGQAVAAVARRNTVLKGSFNVAQWSLATACGAAVVELLGGAGVDPRVLGTLLLALVVVEAVNAVCFTAVLWLATGNRRRAGLAGPEGAVVAAQAGVNAATGVLFALAYAGSPAAVPLFVVPLGLLHLAHRGRTQAQLERERLAGLHAAGTALTAPLAPSAALPPFLDEVAAAFAARLAAVVLRDDDGLRVAVRRRTPEPADDALPDDVVEAVLAEDEPSTLTTGVGEVLVAPLVADGTRLGALAVVDRGGLEGEPAADLSVLVAMAREAAAAFAKGRLVSQVLEERRKLDQLVSTTSDGIFALDADGRVGSWNPAMESITGLPASAVVGVPGGLAALDVRDPDGRPVDLAAWPRRTLPTELLMGARRVACSYARSDDDALVVIARDVTSLQEVERLREASAAQRLVVEHLQRAVMPPLVDVPHTELGVAYVASDPSSPTGGDLYDCLALPSGDLHLAVVDVLGHGTHATRDALAVVHALRNVALAGTDLADVVGAADTLLGRSSPELVATVVVARYEPATGVVRVVTGGHPPPLVVRGDGTVRELEPGGGAIGWPGAAGGDVSELRLAPGDTVVLYTDGLVEAGKDLLEGTRALAASAARLARLPAADLATSLVEAALEGAARRDDTLALVLRRGEVAAVPEQPLETAPAPR